MPEKFLTALPVFNEVSTVAAVLDQVRQYSPEVLVVDDGSDDGTKDVLSQRSDIRLLRHERNQGYGAALISAFQYAIRHEFQTLVTIDCDGQHAPQRIPTFVDACDDFDIVSGSRYLQRFPGDSEPPRDRREVNERITSELNETLGLQLTDSFCGFKAYRVAALNQLKLTETGYAMPLELWVQAAALQLRITELAVPLIYLDESRSFGENLDDAGTRFEHYREVVERSLSRVILPNQAKSVGR